MSTCKDCLCFGMCLLSSEKAGICEEFKDRSKCIELPCNIGDTVYHLLRNGRIVKRKVASFLLLKLEGLCYRFDNNEIYPVKWKTVFLTKEEAERALEERNK